MSKNSDPSQAEFFFGAPPQIFKRAGELRRNQTNAEKLLWEELKEKKINDLRFRRQHPVACFIVDFYCHQKKLVIELDGGIHLNKEVKEKDEQRTIELEKLELKVIRFRNEEVEKNIVDVVDRIKKHTGPTAP
jgi:very-short-patch-repair endonuclease